MQLPPALALIGTPEVGRQGQFPSTFCTPAQYRCAWSTRPICCNSNTCSFSRQANMCDNFFIALMLQILPFGTTCAARAAGRMARSAVHNLAEGGGGFLTQRHCVISNMTFIFKRIYDWSETKQKWTLTSYIMKCSTMSTAKCRVALWIFCITHSSTMNIP